MQSKIVVLLGILLLSLAFASGAQAQKSPTVQANVSIMSISNPCVAGSCQVVFRNDSSDLNPPYNYKDDGYTWALDFHNGPGQPFKDETGPQDPHLKTYTYTYQDAGSHTVEIQDTAADGTATGYSNEIKVAPKADAPAPITYEGPRVLRLPATFSVATPKKYLTGDWSQGHDGAALQVLSHTRDSAGLNHFRVRLPVAKRGPIQLSLDAKNDNVEFQDQSTVNVQVAAVKPYQVTSLKVAVVRHLTMLKVTPALSLYAAQRFTAAFRSVASVKVGSHWKTVGVSTGKTSQNSVYYLQTVNKVLQLRLSHWFTASSRYRHSRIRVRTTSALYPRGNRSSSRQGTTYG